MRLVFGPDDDVEFSAARDQLLDRFGRWLAGTARLGDADAAGTVGDAGLALDWKWSYGDGDLGRWRTGDVGEFLLEWCPRKLSVSPADCESIPDALAAFTAFLDAEGLLGAGSASATALSEAAASLRDEFLAAMGDPSNFGLAKSLFGAATADGIHLDDPDGLQEWIAEFNARPEEERRRIISDPAFAAPGRPALPPVAMPDDAAVAASKATAPILAMFAALADFVGDGRKLTQTGNLTLADARELVDLLGTGDAMDPRIGDRTFKTKSAAELPRLRQVFAWAKKAGVVRVAHRRVIATKRGLAVARDPAGFFDRAVDAVLAIGPLASQRDPDAWLAWPDVNELLDSFVVHLLAGPYVAHRPVPIEDLIDVAAGAVLDAFGFPSLTDDQVVRHLGVDLVDIVDTLELAGVVRRLDLPDPGDAQRPAGRRRHGGSVALTPAGVSTTHRLLVAAGYDAPVAGRFAEATAAELLVGTDFDDFPAVLGEIEAWRRRRDPARAAAEMASAVRELQDPALRNLAFAVLGDMDTALTGPEVRRLADEPSTRGFALCWLVDHGLEDPVALFDPDDPAWFVDVLAQRLVTAGPEGLCDTLALAGSSHEAQVRAIGQLWRSPSPATDAVLTAIGDTHPAKVVAKAARKARFQRRSWLAGS
ncbi:MAG: hypothetical protein ACRDZN_12890 [Acidimicrobiales bacterium]